MPDIQRHAVHEVDKTVKRAKPVARARERGVLRMNTAQGSQRMPALSASTSGGGRRTNGTYASTTDKIRGQEAKLCFWEYGLGRTAMAWWSTPVQLKQRGQYRGSSY
jgi:hypothetical protein